MKITYRLKLPHLQRWGCNRRGDSPGTDSRLIRQDLLAWHNDRRHWRVAPTHDPQTTPPP